MEVRILQEDELKIASGLSRYVFDFCLRNRMEYPQTIAFVESYIDEENLRTLRDEEKLILWGGFEGTQLVAVSGIQSDGMITMLYVLPQWQNKGYGSRLLKAMINYAKEVWGFQKVIVNANPAWTSFFFSKKGFVNINKNQDMRAPFVPMYATSSNIEGYEKRKVKTKWIVLAIIFCFMFATIAGVLFMISYLF